ncbi:hypothetical protein, unlikely [Trypanosoma congolense IL3000]|uniref:Uncharacterized protein n=1 Tax=Trypanosoma congolense (strain IL3000) TaxID=1068625 RepID=F9W5F0_TRYCI|nr:hypothetical protein, unlikely [Trypanosoma congolense IL3000]
MQRELSDKCCRPSAPAGRAASQPFATKPVSESRSRAGPSQRDETSEATCPPPARQDERDLQGKLRDARSKYRRICAENERLKLALDDIAVLLTPRVRDGGSGGACGVPLGYNAALQELVASLQEVTDSMAPSR